MSQIYKNLLNKIRDSEMDQESKTIFQFQLLNIAMNENLYNDNFVESYENQKKETMEAIDGFKKKWEALSDTKKALFEQATETYRPSMCDSSMLGTANSGYLSQIETLFNGKLYEIDSFGCIYPILWNLNDNYGCDQALEIDREKTNDLIEFSNSEKLKKESWAICIEEYLKENNEIYEQRLENTYNDGGYFVILYRIWFIEGEVYYVLQIHIGADVRRGYSKPYVYHFGDIEHYERNIPIILGSYELINFYCQECHQEYYYYNDSKKFYFDKENKSFRCGMMKKVPIENQRTLDGKQAYKEVRCENKLAISFY